MTLLLVLAACVAAGVFIIPRLEGSGPEITAPERIELGAEAQTPAVTARDEGSGIRSFTVHLIQGDRETLLASESPLGDPLVGGGVSSRSVSHELALDFEALELEEGEAELRIVASDWSWRGNESTVTVPILIDTQPPVLENRSPITWVKRGSAAAALYAVGPDAVTHGVRVGESFFPGHPAPGQDDSGMLRVAVFAIPVESPKGAPVSLVARDSSGNEASVRFPARVQERAPVERSLSLDAGFLSRVVRPLAEQEKITSSTDLEAFQKVNSELRARDETMIRERLAETSPTAEWTAGFRQLRGSQVMSRFAEYRVYRFEGRAVSEARHYGYDLASTAGAQVVAAAAGRVVHAGPLGIYGNCVLIDHGLGVGSVYGHLAGIDVGVGDRVERDTPIGRSGDTGLAGGDHLHFAVQVSGEYVDPLDWWDDKWLREHIDVRLAGPTQ